MGFQITDQSLTSALLFLLQSRTSSRNNNYFTFLISTSSVKNMLTFFNEWFLKYRNEGDSKSVWKKAFAINCPKTAVQHCNSEPFSSIVQQHSFVSQLHNKLLFFESKSSNHNRSFIFLDQHAADERIRLEWLLTTIQRSPSHHQSQVLSEAQLIKIHSHWLESNEDDGTSLLPLKINLPITTDQSTRIANLPTNIRTWGLTRWGWVFSADFKLVVGSPVVLGKSKTETLSNWITEVETIGVFPGYVPSFVIKEVESRACRGSVFFNTTLSRQDSLQLVEKLVQCQNPYCCAHGRPLMIKISL
ncbi:hypothetical protein GEMRC1_006590 [Eukaryota sp. GEM-RC1]